MPEIKVNELKNIGESLTRAENHLSDPERLGRQSGHADTLRRMNRPAYMAW